MMHPRWTPLLAAFMITAIACQRSSAPQGAAMAEMPTPAKTDPLSKEDHQGDRIAPEPLVIHRSVPPLVQVLPGRLPDPSSSDGSSAEWLELRVAETGKVFQRLEYPWFGGMSQPALAEVVDLDGDGYMDLRALAGLCATQDYCYAWRYHPQRRQFQAIPGFEDIPSPEPDGRGRIRSWYRTGPDSGIETIYAWRKGRLVELGSKMHENK